MLDITSIDLYIGMAINGIFTGLGVTIGSYLANNHLIARIKKMKKNIKKIFF